VTELQTQVCEALGQSCKAACCDTAQVQVQQRCQQAEVWHNSLVGKLWADFIQEAEAELQAGQALVRQGMDQ
jgi:hypothetical protein